MLVLAMAIKGNTLTVPTAEWLEGLAGKHGIVGSSPRGDIHYHFEFFAYGTWLHLGEDHTNEIKHDIHPE